MHIKNKSGTSIGLLNWLFWPYSSGIPGQWMFHQIDTVHWFSDFPYPRSVAADGGIYLWNDGRENFDTMPLYSIMVH